MGTRTHTHISILSMLVLLATAASVGAMEQFTQEFHKESLNPRVLKRVGGSAQMAVEETDNGLLISLPFTGIKTAQAGIGTTFAVQGDFEVTVAYQLVELDKVDRGYGAGVMLSLITAEQPAVTVNLAHRKQPGGKAAFGTNIWSMVKQKMKHDQKPFDVAATVDRGQMRVVRTGSTLRFLVAEGQSAEFRELRQSEFGTEPLRSVQVVGDTGGSTRPVKVLLTQLSIRADAMPMGLPPRKQRTIWAIWTILGLVGVTVLSGAAVWYWRRPSGQESAGPQVKPARDPR